MPLTLDVGAPMTITLPEYNSWNIDSSANRQFFERNLADPELHYLAAASLPGFLRFGGTGNDELTYGIGNLSCAGAPYCLNETLFVNLLNFSHAAGAKLVFGLNIAYRTSEGRWDPAPAEVLIRHGLALGFEFYAFELGNEQNDNYSPESEAADFAILHKLLDKIYDNQSLATATRPKIFGPDPHSFHDVEESTLTFLQKFAQSALEQGVDLYAVTHHEQVIVQPANAPGEIGPHNGGSPGCNHSSMRWATFADVFWYLDALGAKAAAGYAAFCRQNFIGIDYGLLDCATHEPLPDFYASLLWSATMGTAVLNATSPEGSVRFYAHCGSTRQSPFVHNLHSSPVTVSVLLLNLAETPQSVGLPASLANATASVFVLESGPAGPAGTQVKLNGEMLEYSYMQLPTLVGERHQLNSTLVLPPQSASFLSIEDVAVPACFA
ncbi:uncharacterized protein MONBRDRAFT_30511 [Monosiga brevicollis MX1]|uniref:Beta-glucuronidase C-terminal domain-containing protein n=1 Tax=Monosiga brevicollis TaxID=81824 RepID=A9VE64_MONBE|nr:uncharacterized protein MONBRDRAFT_30511 [Monosiga brevicollis MX1]EDQ84175.1 predicted protein [Monosiga brevicollis MX1]|eukprot:XP_001751005.1 hypothetical protein [Monosiga brevicollis MX1]